MIFVFNLLLALAWMALTGQFDPVNFVAGFILAALLLRLVLSNSARRSYFSRGSRLFRFVLFFLKEMILANLRVAITVLSPRLRISPALIEIPLEARSDLSISLLANLITLTPGTLTLDISNDRRVIFVHTMYAEDTEEFKRSIKSLERRVLEVTA